MKSLDGVHKTSSLSILRISSMAKYKEAARGLPEVLLLCFCAAIAHYPAYRLIADIKLDWKTGLEFKAILTKKGQESQGQLQGNALRDECSTARAQYI